VPVHADELPSDRLLGGAEVPVHAEELPSGKLLGGEEVPVHAEELPSGELLGGEEVLVHAVDSEDVVDDVAWEDDSPLPSVPPADDVGSQVPRSR
jgi:hypothetical protein